MLPEISKLRREIMSIHISGSDWQDRLIKWKRDLETSQEQVSEWFRRQALLIQATELSSKRWSGSKWFKAQDTTEWETGLSHIVGRTSHL